MIKWFFRISAALITALVLGGLPVYITSEINDLSKLKSELKEIKQLNNRLFSELEISSDKLKSLKTQKGMERLLMEHGYMPEGAKVYQLETSE